MSPRKILVLGSSALCIVLILVAFFLPSHKKSAQNSASSSQTNSHGPPQLTASSAPAVSSTTQSVAQTNPKADNSDDPPEGYGTAPPTSEGFATPQSGLIQKFDIPPDWQTVLDAGTNALALYGTPDPSKDTQAAIEFDNDILSAWRSSITDPHRSGHTDVVQAWFSKPFADNQTKAVIAGFCRFTADGKAADSAVGCRTTQQRTLTGWQTVGIEFDS